MNKDYVRYVEIKSDTEPPNPLEEQATASPV